MHSILSWITKLPFLIPRQSTTRAQILIFNHLLPSFLLFIAFVLDVGRPSVYVLHYWLMNKDASPNGLAEQSQMGNQNKDI